MISNSAKNGHHNGQNNEKLAGLLEIIGCVLDEDIVTFAIEIQNAEPLELEH